MIRGCLLALALVAGLPAKAQPVTVFAAASLSDAMKSAASAWTRSGNPAPRLSFGASSALARQIEQGAPATLFASADQRWMDYLAERNLIVPETRRDLLGNDLVLIVPLRQTMRVTIGPGMDLTAILGPNGRLATGDPANVPVGLYARQALTSFGLWDALAPRLARTTDVRQALLLVEREEAPAGIVYATDAVASRNVAVAGVFPAGSHDPVTYPFAMVREGDTQAGRAFLLYLTSADARALFVQHGFKVP